MRRGSVTTNSCRAPCQGGTAAQGSLTPATSSVCSHSRVTPLFVPTLACTSLWRLLTRVNRLACEGIDAEWISTPETDQEELPLNHVLNALRREPPL